VPQVQRTFVSEIIIITMITTIARLGASGESGIVLRVLTKTDDSMLLTKELGWGDQWGGGRKILGPERRDRKGLCETFYQMIQRFLMILPPGFPDFLFFPVTSDLELKGSRFDPMWIISSCLIQIFIFILLFDQPSNVKPDLKRTFI